MPEKLFHEQSNRGSDPQTHFKDVNRTLYKISSAINKATTLEELYQLIHKELSGIIDTTNFFISIYDKTEDRISFPYIIDSVDECYPPVLEVSKTESLAAEVIRTGQPLLVTKDEIIKRRAETMHSVPACTPAEIWLGVPLKTQNEILGVMAVQSYTDSQRFDASDSELMSFVANHLAFAIERKQNEHILRSSEQKFRNIVQESPMGIHLYELKENDRLVFTGANPTSDRLLGVDHVQFIGKTIEDAFPGLVETEVPERYRDAAKNGIVWRTEQIDYREGSIHGAFEVAAFQTEPGKMAVFFNEITERKQMEDELRKSEERFRTLVEKSPFGISLIGGNGRYKYINPQFSDIFGYSAEDIPTGKIWFEKVFPEKKYRKDVIKTWIKDQGQARIGQARTRVFDVICKNGSQKKICFIPVTMENLDQFVIYEDITDKSKVEQKLQQAQKFEAIGTLAGGIAHDFNNLLMGIQGRTSLVSVGLESNHTHLEHLKAIEDYIKSASNLTKQLLGFARGGKYEVKPININQLLLESSGMFGRTRKEIKIHTKIPQGEIVIEADRSQIEQVLLNMYVNSWQAMPDGGSLFLESKTVMLDEEYCQPYQVKPGQYVKISITDTGVGMKESTRRRVFDPFFTTKEKGRGTGLGLASAYGIIKNHKGIITLYSEDGHGTTFNIYLPISKKEARQTSTVEMTMVKGSETILLVDDEEMIIDVAQAMLERLGYRVIVSQSGLDAVEKVERIGNEIDLVILDLIMPEMEGGKAFDRIREIEPKIPILLSSGYAINGQATEIMRRGCNGFIQKPFGMSEISQKIRKVLNDVRKA